MDTSWLFSYKNKENNNPNLYNESFNGSLLNCASLPPLPPSGGGMALSSSTSATNILNVTNPNMSGIINMLSVNDSFDAERTKMDVYEKSIQKLSADNKSLLKRVKKLTDLARVKEEQLMEALNQVYDAKQKLEEKNQIEHR